MDSEKKLIDRIKKGDTSAFRDLVEANKRMVFHIAYDLTNSREDAEDVSQEVFFKAFKSINKFRGSSKFSTWLYRITVNTCYSMGRKKSYKEMHAEENMEEVISNENVEKNHPENSNPVKVLESSFIMKHIDKAVQKLSQREKSVFVLRNYNGLPFGDIVEILKLSPGTVRSVNFRALKKLRQELAFYKEEI
ncbi:MAG: sigma-70 family RNA polymerase sigma factor [Melioribacteraceae bacterium]|nr:sigma-70 family RNA polymerase sigma factor [Melioribacteraceae bacterium]MCF8353382.1 sigma-70 family RNA polymerase sigma factor [Melioribacteraceae bacterium]MCF8393039.1 sigma-70 family RNA polymerase sigma factor [Melioribacteraceae bacterium]MCF8419108.1 sigma-70 family RNA polymerase sigma factor [Melioribacteraceae bacterium]